MDEYKNERRKKERGVDAVCVGESVPAPIDAKSGKDRIGVAWSAGGERERERRREG